MIRISVTANAFLKILDGFQLISSMVLVFYAQAVYKSVLKENVKHSMETTAFRVQLVQGLMKKDLGNNVLMEEQMKCLHWMMVHRYA